MVERRAVTFRFASSLMESLTGWVVGWDAYHWVVLDAEGVEHLVHKGNASIVTLTDQRVEPESPLAATYETIVAPFRAHLINNGFAPAHLETSC